MTKKVDPAEPEVYQCNGYCGQGRHCPARLRRHTYFPIDWLVALFTLVSLILWFGLWAVT